MNEEFAPFSAADYLDNDETIAEYIAVVAEEGEPAVMRAALAEVASAAGEWKFI